MAEVDVVTTEEIAQYSKEGGTLSTGIFGNTEGLTYCSFTPQSKMESALLFNAVTNPAERLADHINETIMVSDVYCEIIRIAEEDREGNPVLDADLNPSFVEVPRIIFFANDRRTYQAVSKGIFNSLPRLFKSFGEPTWIEAIPLKVKQVKVSNGTMLTFEINVEML